MEDSNLEMKKRIPKKAKNLTYQNLLELLLGARSQKPGLLRQVTDEEIFFRRIVDWRDSKNQKKGFLLDFLLSENKKTVEKLFLHDLNLYQTFHSTIKKTIEKRKEILTSKLNEFQTRHNAPQIFTQLVLSLEEFLNNQMFILDKKLMSFSFQYFRSLDEEKRSFHSMNRYKEAKHTKSLSFINFCYKMRKFAALLDYETAAQCNQLEPQEGMFNQCRVRLSHAVKENYFDDSLYSTINILDIYHLKNNINSERFYLHASPNCETKRLYTSVKRSQLQRLTIAGFGSLNSDEQLALHENFWNLESNSKNSKIDKILAEKANFEFPLCFSTFCTLEGDRENFIDKTTTGFFFLVECSVFFEKTLEVEDLEELRNLDSTTEYDSVFVRSTQEYWLYNPLNILPEFLVVHDYLNSHRANPMNKANYEEIKKVEEATREDILRKIKIEISIFLKELEDFFNLEVNALIQSQLVRIEQLRSEIKHYKQEIAKVNKNKDTASIFTS